MDNEIIEADLDWLHVKNIHNIDPGQFSWLVSKWMAEGMDEEEAREYSLTVMRGKYDADLAPTKRS